MNSKERYPTQIFFYAWDKFIILFFWHLYLDGSKTTILKHQNSSLPALIFYWFFDLSENWINHPTNTLIINAVISYT